MVQSDFKRCQSFWTEFKRQCAIVCLMVVLTVTVLPTIFFILLPASVILRLIVKWIAAGFRSDLSGIFRGRGIGFAVDSIEKRPDCNILFYLFCNTDHMPVEEFRRQFERRVLNYTDEAEVRPYEKLAQTWTSFMGFIFWKWDKNFKLSNHIRPYDYTHPELALPPKCAEDDLKRVTGALVARPWVEGRSPWEILIVPLYRTNQEPDKAGSVVILRVHHANIDGHSIFTMLLTFSDSLSVKRTLPNFPKLSPLKTFTRPLLLLLKLPYDLAEYMIDSYDGPNSWHLEGKKLTRKYHVFFSDGINVEKIKEIRRKYGVDYNAAVYSVTAGSIRRLMLASGHELPDSLSVIVPFPEPNHPGGLCMHTASVAFKFSPRIASAKERIGEIAANLKSLQQLPTGPTTCFWLADLMGLFPICLLRILKPSGTVAMTSVAGPEVEIPMVGESKWTSMCLALSHTSELGAVGGMVTMDGKQTITLTVDKAIYAGYKVPERFHEFVHQEIEELLN